MTDDPLPSSVSQALNNIAKASELPEKASELPEVAVEHVEIEESSRLVLFTDPRSPGADRFRYLRMRLRELRDVTKLQTLVITSALPQDGKSTVAMNLATALTERGKRGVLLIEGDLHNPSVAERLRIQKRPGLSECLETGADVVSCLRRVDPLGWYLLQAGTPMANPTEMLQSDSLPVVLQTLSAYFEWILIDSPPVAPLSDAVVLSRQADATLLVVRADHTPRDMVKTALALLGTKRPVAIILNGAKALNRLYAKYPQYYGRK
jgi:capsular exopolysaccharide synthesis family protein